MSLRFIVFTPLSALALAGCSEPDSAAPVDPATTVGSFDAASAETRSPAAGPATASARSSAVASSGPSASRDPQVVVRAWAEAIRARDWPGAYSYWGDRGTRSGKTLSQFTAQWSPLRAPRVEMGHGSQEGAAGSLYYTVPVTITDGERRFSGEMVLRRVNDVEGASAEQLRWHIESATFHP